MLAGAVNTSEGFFVQQTDQTVLRGNLLHDFHCQLVVIGCNVCGGVDGRKLVLSGSHLVVLGLRQDTQLPQLLVQVSHVGGDSGLDNAKVMIIHLLTLGGLCAEQGAPGVDQILALVVHFLINQEILLLGANGGTNALHILVAKELQDAHGLTVQRFHGAEQRRFLVQRLTAVGAERGGNAKGLSLNKSVRCGIPGGVASGFKGRPQAAGGEAGSIRLALDQFLAGKVHDDAAVRSGGDEAVMLFRSNSSQRLEPMGEVGSSIGDCPILHGGSNSIRDTGIQLCALIDGLAQRLINTRA